MLGGAISLFLRDLTKFINPPAIEAWTRLIKV